MSDSTAPPPGTGSDVPPPAATSRAGTAPDLVTPFINHVLGQHAWARATLRGHAGRSVEARAQPFIFRWVITPEGLVQAAPQGMSARNGSHQGAQAGVSSEIWPNALHGMRPAAAIAAAPGATNKASTDAASEITPDVTLSLPLTSLPLFALDPASAMKQVRIEGDAELAQALGQLAREVRWDAEDDLARITGGAAAHRLMQGAKSFRTYAQDASQRLQETVSAFLLDEDPTLVRRAAHESFARDVGTLRDDVARLEKRIERLGARSAPD